MTSLLVFAGSTRQQSFNRRLAMAMMRLGPADFTFAEAPIGELPLYNQDDDAHQAPQVQRLRDEIKAASAVLFVTGSLLVWSLPPASPVSRSPSPA